MLADDSFRQIFLNFFIRISGFFQDRYSVFTKHRSAVKFRGSHAFAAQAGAYQGCFLAIVVFHLVDEIIGNCLWIRKDIFVTG